MRHKKIDYQFQRLVSNSIKFEKISDNEIQHVKVCHAIAINQSNSLLLASADEQIKIFSLKSGILKEIQIISQSQKHIITLNFFSNKSFIVSGSDDNSIIISSNNLLSNPKIIQRLKGHFESITCILIHPTDQNQIISGSIDTSIKFWLNIQQQFQLSQQINDHTDYVYGLSVNEKGNQLITCGRDSRILIIELDKENVWRVKQKIRSEQFGFRISFIKNQLFVFQQYDNPYLSIYSSNSDGVYIKIQKLPVENGILGCNFLFPIQYNDQKQVIINKNGNFINVIKFNQIYIDGYLMPELKLEQTIDFIHSQLYGTLSPDGQYLATWDYIQKLIQIRIYHS